MSEYLDKPLRSEDEVRQQLSRAAMDALVRGDTQRALELHKMLFGRINGSK